jgi:ABC-type phosphate transport system permease subunit
VIGATTHGVNLNLLLTGDTLASRIASQYQGATSNLQIGALFYLGVILLVMSLVTNFAAQIIVRRYQIERGH